jgi:O-antigen/teichoic acid export membrane protein
MKLKNFSKGLFGGSVILLITMNLFNALNYFFQFVMVRMLGAINYGILAALLAIIYVFNVFGETIQIVMAKYTAGERETGKLKNALRRATKKSLNISFILFLIYLVVAIFLSKFLKIEYSLLFLVGLILITVFLLPINRGILQGMKKFNAFGFNMILEAVVKLGLAILLVFIGWKVYGAITGLIVGGLVAFLFSFLSLKKILKSKEETTDTKEIYKYSLPMLVVMFVIVAFYSMDVILAKAFFSETVAGQYAIASILSRIILFGTFPISRAMFPISSEVSGNSKSSRKILYRSLLILSFGVMVALAIMGLFPEFMVRIFSGENYPAASGILFNLSIAMSLMSFSNLILLYNLSIGKTKNYGFMFLFLIMEVFLLSIFHSNLVEYSITLIFLNMLFLFGSIFLLGEKNEKT